MNENKVCKNCGVPLGVGGGHNWESSSVEWELHDDGDLVVTIYL